MNECLSADRENVTEHTEKGEKHHLHYNILNQV